MAIMTVILGFVAGIALIVRGKRMNRQNTPKFARVINGKWHENMPGERQYHK